MATAELETKTDLQPAAPSSVSLAISFEETRGQLTELVARSSELVVTDVNDKAGIAEVREHRLEFKRIRVSIENRRKSIKAPLLEAERKVDSMAKELTAIIEPEEKRLEHQEKIVEREKALMRDAMFQPQEAQPAPEALPPPRPEAVPVVPPVEEDRVEPVARHGFSGVDVFFAFILGGVAMLALFVVAAWLDMKTLWPFGKLLG
mgnify:CR=1 FL=1